MRREAARPGYALVWIRVVEDQRRVEDVRVAMRIVNVWHVFTNSNRAPNN